VRASGRGGRRAVLTDSDLYARGAATLVASWEEYARGASGAWVQRSHGVAVAVFPEGPERSVYNNALVERGLEEDERVDAVNLAEAVYATAGIERYAVWAHESEEGLRRLLVSRGYALETSTRAMGMNLDAIRLQRPEVDLGPPDWPEYLRLLGLPSCFLAGADPAAYQVRIGRLDRENVATAMAFDHAGDCGIYNVGTLEHARRRGLGTALTVLHMHDALARGCRTASLQSTAMAERIYAVAGFRDLGRFLEFTPPSACRVGYLAPVGRRR
jgi:ribosomal protein S18 acetylase RimI-like enzyme